MTPTIKPANKEKADWIVLGTLFKIIKKKEVTGKSAVSHIKAVIKNLISSSDKEKDLCFSIYL